MNIESLRQKRTGIVFVIFCLWTFVVLCRPQDIILTLKPLRPAFVTGIMTLWLVAHHLRELKSPLFFQERQVKHYTTLLLLMVIGVPTSLYARQSFMIIFTEYINVIIFFYIFYKIVDSVEKLSTVLLVGCLGNGLYSAFSLTKGNLDTGRLSFGTMFDPNDLAYFALGFLPLNLIFISRGNPLWCRLTCLVSFGIGAMLILLTGSRGGLLGFVMAAAMLLFLKTKTFGFHLKGFFVVLCFAIISFSSINTERFMTLSSIKDDYNVYSETGRLSIWKAGVKAMIENPLTGVGVGCFAKAIGLDREARGAATLRWQAPHSSLLQIGTETGIFGLFFFSIMSFNVVRIFRKIIRISLNEKLIKISEMGLIGFVGLFVSGLFLSQAYSFYWAFYVAISASISQLLARESVTSAVIDGHGNV